MPGQRSASVAGPAEANPATSREGPPSTAASTRCLLVGGLVIASRQRSRQTCSASSLVSSASRSCGTIPAKPQRQDATWMRARLAASPARAGRTKPAITSEPTGPNGPGSPPSARRRARAEMVRERLVGGLEDAFDLLVCQRPNLTLPGPPAQVLAQ